MDITEVKTGQKLYTVVLRLEGYNTEREPKLIEIVIGKETATRFKIESGNFFEVSRYQNLEKGDKQLLAKLATTPAGAWAIAQERIARRIESARADLTFYTKRSLQIDAAHGAAFTEEAQ